MVSSSSTFSFASTSSVLLLLVFLPSMATPEKTDIYMAPTHSPFNNDICNEINCGRGHCAVDSAQQFNFVCNCEPGWRRTRSNNEVDHQFLPCVIPDCTLDYSCMPNQMPFLTPPPPPPPPSFPIPNDFSLFDPCSYAYCGQGNCNKNHTYTHTCDCYPGYTNLMNVAEFPCFSSCAIGTDCSRLGVRLSDSFTPPGFNPTGFINSGNRFLSGSSHWIGFIVMSLAMAVWE